MNLADGEPPLLQLGDQIVERVLVFGEKEKPLGRIGKNALLGQLRFQPTQLDLVSAVLALLRLLDQPGDFLEFDFEIGLAPGQGRTLQFALFRFSLGIVHLIPFLLGGEVGHRNNAELAGRFEQLLQGLFSAEQGLLQRVRRAGHPHGLILDVTGDGFVELHLLPFEAEGDGVRNALFEKLEGLPGSIGLRLRKIQHDFLGAPEVARCLPTIHGVVNRFHVGIRFLVEKLEE
ncbi:MAG: hypothetical protein HW398_1340 [Acidobacteria bacterium]|nr:hypothetical protein [Acidobacteriota bacterium]